MHDPIEIVPKDAPSNYHMIKGSNEQNIHHVIRMRCGVCQSDLNRVWEWEQSVCVFTDKQTQIDTEWTIGRKNLLDMLADTNFLDGFDDRSKEEQDTILQHDLKIV